MKEIVKVVEVSGEGLESLLGKEVVFLCKTYFYTGILVGVNDSVVKVEKPSIIYETGPWTNAKWQDVQSLNRPYGYLFIAQIEFFFEG